MKTAAASAVAPALLPAAASAPALSGSYYRDYSRCLPDFLAGLAREAYTSRHHALARLTTAKAVEERQDWARKILWDVIGGSLERTPLNGSVMGRLERTAYALEKVRYESRPGVVVTANLYLPKTGKPPYPGVLFQMGHAENGKAYASYQKCCQGLVQLGYAVLAFDPMGQGERIAYVDKSGIHTRLPSVDEEHTIPGKQLLLLGDTATRYQLWDAIRSLDYLASQPMVDSKRLASVGQSGGATLSMLLACVDDRLSTALICSGNTENFATLEFNPPGSTDDAEQNLIGSSPLGFDRWDLLYPLAPKPLLIQVSAHDFYGTYSPQYLVDGGREFAQLQRVYEILGHADRIGWRSTPLPHGLTYAFRMDVYDWCERWLKSSPTKIEQEPPVQPEEERDLWVGPTGNVMRDFGSLRPFDLIQREAKANTANDTSQAPTHDWVQSLCVHRPASTQPLRRLATTSLSGIRVIAGEVNSSPGVWIPVWLFVPDKPDLRRSALLVLDDHGRNDGAHEDGLYHRLARSGMLVCAADIRGIGDTRPEVGRGNPGYTIAHASEEEYAWASLVLGRPLLGQRITDILSLAATLAHCEEASNRQVSLAARGRLTIPSLFAFAADVNLASLYLCGGLASYRSLLEVEDYSQPLANFAWNLFRQTDLPQLAETSAPRRIHISGALNGAGQELPEDIVRRMYPGGNVTISSGARWDDETLEGI